MDRSESQLKYAATDRQMALLAIETYARWMQEKVDDGWDPYLMTFMFNHLPYGSGNRFHTMMQQVENVYVKVLHNVLRRSIAPAQIEKRPIWIVCPDFPVWKHAKQDIRDISINDGQHIHALGVFPNDSRLRTAVTWLIRDRPHIFAPPGGLLRRVQADLITSETTGYVMGYILKSIAKRRATLDDILVLPRAREELIRKPTALNPSLGKRLRR